MCQESPDENCETCFGNTHLQPLCLDCEPESLTCSTCVDGKEFNATYGCGAAEALGWEPCCD